MAGNGVAGRQGDGAGRSEGADGLRADEH